MIQGPGTYHSQSLIRERQCFYVWPPTYCIIYTSTSPLRLSFSDQFSADPENIPPPHTSLPRPTIFHILHYRQRDPKLITAFLYYSQIDPFFPCPPPPPPQVQTLGALLSSSFHTTWLGWDPFSRLSFFSAENGGPSPLLPFFPFNARSSRWIYACCAVGRRIGHFYTFGEKKKT